MITIEHIRWILGPEDDVPDRLIKALATCGFRVNERWRYPPQPDPFTVPFSDGIVEITVEFEATEGVLVTGPEKAIQIVRVEYERLQPP